MYMIGSWIDAGKSVSIQLFGIVVQCRWTLNRSDNDILLAVLITLYNMHQVMICLKKGGKLCQDALEIDVMTQIFNKKRI